MTSSLVWQIVALCVLLLCSGFFSIAETSLMAANRHRVRHLAKRGSKGAELVLWLLARTEKLLALILIGNTLLNAAITALVTALAIQSFGNNETVITIATGVVAFLIIVFSEITPKVVGAAYPERIALPAAFVLKPLLKISQPVVWFVNLFVIAILKMLRINTQNQGHNERLSPEELRSMVLEQSQFIAHKPRAILNNLFDLDQVAVDDIMTARAQIEAIDISQKPEQIQEQLATCYHNKLLIYDGEINNIKGILHVRKALSLLREPEFSVEDLVALSTPPYFVPAGVGAFKQLQFFRKTANV
jgi:Mg2+/Co2+ transporter CorB